MKRIYIKKQTPGKRCEICHLEDQFDAQNNYCLRCSEVSLDAQNNKVNLFEKDQSGKKRIFNNKNEKDIGFLSGFFAGMVCGGISGFLMSWLAYEYLFLSSRDHICGQVWFVSIGISLGLSTSLLMWFIRIFLESFIKIYVQVLKFTLFIFIAIVWWFLTLSETTSFFTEKPWAHISFIALLFGLSGFISSFIIDLAISYRRFSYFNKLKTLSVK